MTSGGSDPRTTTREQLLSTGVPLHCKYHSSMVRSLAPSMAYSNQKLAQIKLQRINASLPPLSCAETQVLVKEFNKTFYTETEEVQSQFKSGSSDNDDPTTLQSTAAYRASRRFHLCKKSEPVLEERVSQVFSANAGAENVGGLSRTASKLRRDFANFSVMHDKGEL